MTHLLLGTLYETIIIRIDDFFCFFNPYFLGSEKCCPILGNQWTEAGIHIQIVKCLEGRF